jgi:hypothetical protein
LKDSEKECSGMHCLKDKNLIKINKLLSQDSEDNKGFLNIDKSEKEELLEQLKIDSAMLKSCKLIDYSIYLIQVD